ncbi:MAG: PEP-utilizing enzyme [Acetatifactor muris]|nr:PEP-utilizing enzyme [Acetatifactor muris]MCM1525706.1 PEP-utilizing enzyme [Bacteroides sp.]
MKAYNLQRLKDNCIAVPDFVTVDQELWARLSAQGQDAWEAILPQGEFWAVRSSYSGEDGKQTSYAGQFDTLLNIRRADVPEAVRKVMASLEGERIRRYEKARGARTRSGHGGNDGNRMRVIVQKMVQAEMSGVLFTANPMGLMNEMVIVVGEGLGELVVEDRTQVTTCYYNTTDHLYYCSRQQDSPELSDARIRELTTVGARIHELFGREMDIEFAIEKDRLWILQARPITAMKDGLEIILDNSNIVESYPGVTLPLSQSFVSEIYYGVFRSCLLRLTGEPKTVKRMDGLLRRMVDSANGRVYYRISNWYSFLKFLPFSGKIIPIWQEMLGVRERRVTRENGLKNDAHVGNRTKWRVTRSFFRLLRTCPAEMKNLNQYFAQVLPVYREQIEKARDGEDLLELYGRIRTELCARWDITLVNDMYTFLYTAAARKFHAADLAGVKKLESMRPVRAVRKLAEIAQRYGLESAEYERMESRYIERYGDRCPEELKLETHTFRTHPELLRAYVEQLTRSDAVAADRGIGRAGSADRNGSAMRIRNAGRLKTGCAGMARNRARHRESGVLRRAKLGIRNREISRMNRSRIFGMTREIFLKIGEWMVQNGRLRDREDIFYLFLDEVRESVRNGGSCGELVESRKQEYDAYVTLPAYSRLIFRGEVFDKQVRERISVRFCPEEERGEASCLYGTPCSPGVVRGEVLVVERPQETLDAGNRILVTKMTDPGWVFLIHRSAGIIAEKGSLLSHTAIITRELGKPAVVGLSHAMELLRTGDEVELDGDAGTVRVLRRAEKREEYQ